LDEGESELDAALRETEEEAGLAANQLTVAKDFTSELNYEVRGKPKRVVYWLAELKKGTPDDCVKLSDEHTDYKWLELTEALEYAKYKDMQKSLSDADSFIHSKLMNCKAT